MRGGKRHGAGRPKGKTRPPRTLMHLRVLPDTFRTIDLLAFAKGQSRGEIVDQLARRAVRKRPPCPKPPAPTRMPPAS